MAWSYIPLWKLLLDHKMTKTALRKEIHMGTATLASMGKDEEVSMDVLGRICKLFDCQLSDIVQYVPDKAGKKHS